MPNPLDSLRKAQTIGADPNPAEGSWGDSAISGLVGAIKGFTGLGDQGPAGATATNFGQILGAALPFAGKRDILRQLIHPKLEFEDPAAVAAKQFFGEPSGYQPLPGGRVEARLGEMSAGSPNRFDTAVTPPEGWEMPPNMTARPLLRELRGLDIGDRLADVPAQGPNKSRAIRYPSSVRAGASREAAPQFESKFGVSSNSLTPEEKRALYGKVASKVRYSTP